MFLLVSTGTMAWAIPIHEHGSLHTTWEKDAEGVHNFHPNDPARGGGDPEAGDTRHQHYDATPLVDEPSRADPFTVAGVWDNRSFYSLPEAPYPIVPHGFIDESNPDKIPRYRFNGANWTDNDPNTKTEAEQAQGLLEHAFQEWSALEAGKSPVSGLPLDTGLAFTKAAPDLAAAEISVFWGGTTGLGRTRFTVGDGGVAKRRPSGALIDVRFNNSANFWFFGKAAATPVDDPGTPENEARFHFYSTALHEIGHVVGLFEQEDMDDVMIEGRQRGPTGTGTGPAFDTLDNDSKRGAYALYSIVPAPSGLILVSTVFAIVLAKRTLAGRTRLSRGRRWDPSRAQATRSTVTQ
jgi:hypothetical protein